MMAFRRLFFSIWYLLRPPWETGIVPPEVVSHIRTHPPGRALDLGCGSGTSCIALASAGWIVTGVDFIPSAIQSARRKAAEAGVCADFRLGDVTHLENIDGPFDLVLDIGCFHNLTRKQKCSYLDQVNDLLSPDAHWMKYAHIKKGDGRGGGLTESDLHDVPVSWKQILRQNCSEGNERPAVWLVYQKRISESLEPV